MTRFPAGSLREVCAISLPLMLALFSSCAMLFADRLILAHFSTEVMNATTVMWEAAAIFTFFAVGVAMIIEVFVGRVNGAGRLQEAGIYTWQMLWFSLATVVGFVPIALLGAHLTRSFLPHLTLGAPYFQWILLFGPTAAIGATFNSFFVGLGKVRLVALVAVGTNALNIGLDILFVLKWEMGSGGAAVATGLTQAVGLIPLAWVFFNARHRDRYGTSQWHLRPKILMETLRIGIPSAMGHLIEIAAWATLMQLVILAGDVYITVIAIGQGFFFLFAFVTEGLNKGVATIAANMLGAKQEGHIPRLIRSGLLLHVAVTALLGIPLLLYPHQMIELFLPNGTDLTMASQAAVALRWVWAYFLMDGVVWTFVGVVTAGGDTRFVMWTNGLTAWGFAILPNVIGLFVIGMGPEWIWPLKLIYCAVNGLLFYLRYKGGRWVKEIAVSEEMPRPKLAEG